jgi:DNA-binding MarR family transcriptional regulator
MSQVEVEDSVGYLVKRVQQALRRTCDAELKDIGLSMAQYAVLRALDDHPDASAAELARLCFVTRQSLRDVLGGLTASGYAEVAETPARGRARAVRLTPEGRRRLGEAHAAVLSAEAVMVSGIAPHARKELAGLLVRCAENLERS